MDYGKAEGSMLFNTGAPLLSVPNGDVTGDLFLKPEGFQLINELGDAIYGKPQTIKYHAHPTGAETFLVLRGKVRMHVNSKWCDVTKGDIMHIRAHVYHGFEILEPDTAWREMFQQMDMYAGLSGKSNLRTFYPELLEDETFTARRLARAGIDYRESPPLEEASKYDVPHIKPADKHMLTFDVPFGKLHLRVGRWELGGVKEIWQFDMRQGACLDFAMPFGDKPVYHVLEGVVRVDSDRESFDAGEGDIISIPQYLKHKLTVKEDAKLLALNVQSRLLNIMERFNADKVKNPEVLEDWEYISKSLAEHNCWLTGFADSSTARRAGSC